jgi:hypothetical protein
MRRTPRPGSSPDCKDDVADANDLPQADDSAPDMCFGYLPLSTVAFTACRRGTDSAFDHLEISESARELEMCTAPLLEWHEAGRPFARLWDDSPRFTVWIDGIGWFQIDRSVPSIELPAESNGIRREARLWGVPAALCFMGRGDLPLHAAAVDVNGSAVVFAAPGRYGKTTLAAAFMQAGHRLLSEDLTCVRTNQSVAVWPGPALLRIRKDAFHRLSFSDADVVDEDETRMYVMPDRQARGSGAAVPLRAIVFLRTHDSPELVLERVEETRAALPDLWTLSFNMPNDTDRTRCFSTITELAASVPIWNLARPLTYESLPRVIETIENLLA